jgi:hypothetical protein
VARRRPRIVWQPTHVAIYKDEASFVPLIGNRCFSDHGFRDIGRSLSTDSAKQGATPAFKRRRGERQLSACRGRGFESKGSAQGRALTSHRRTRSIDRRSPIEDRRPMSAGESWRAATFPLPLEPRMHVPIGARPGLYPRLAYARPEDRARLLCRAQTPCFRGNSQACAANEPTREPSQIRPSRDDSV